MKKLEKHEVEWVADKGTIRTARTIDVKTGAPGAGSFMKVHEYIAFNVGQDMAEHIVSLHNAALQVNRG